MNNFFEGIVQYPELSNKGKWKKMKMQILVDALSFSEAEQKIIEHMQCYSAELEVTNLKVSKVTEVHDKHYDKQQLVLHEGDKWFLVKIAYPNEYDLEKKCTSQMLVLASDLEKAKDYTEEIMRGSMLDWSFATISETKFTEVV